MFACRILGGPSACFKHGPVRSDLAAGWDHNSLWAISRVWGSRCEEIAVASLIIHFHPVFTVFYFALLESFTCVCSFTLWENLFNCQIWVHCLIIRLWTLFILLPYVLPFCLILWALNLGCNFCHLWYQFKLEYRNSLVTGIYFKVRIHIWDKNQCSL